MHSVPAAAAPVTSGAAVRVSHRPKVKHKHPEAKKASAITCTLTAQVSLVYALS